jgi:hypothetical protein
MKIKGILEGEYWAAHMDQKYFHPTMDQLVATIAQTLCEETINHIEVAERQPEWLGNQHVCVRFEDIAY